MDIDTCKRALPATRPSTAGAPWAHRLAHSRSRSLRSPLARLVDIQHLSPLLATVTNRTALDFATREFAEPLGVPNLFLYDDLPRGGISAGGGQMSTCSDLLRLGQLLLNKGKWLDRGGAPYQLMPEAYVEAMTSPAHDFAPTYGYLSWLNRPVGDAHCCAPRWGGKKKLCVEGQVQHGTFDIIFGTLCHRPHF